MAISEKSNIFLWLAISKRIELQLPDWWHLVGHSLKFQNLTTFAQSDVSKLSYTPFSLLVYLFLKWYLGYKPIFSSRLFETPKTAINIFYAKISAFLKLKNGKN